MLTLAANVSLLFTERPFLERFAAAAEAGFTAVECLFPYEFAVDEVAQALSEYRLTQALFNLPPGDWEAGERGLACLPGREAELRAGVAQALEYAEALGCDRLHMMAGVVPKRGTEPTACAALTAYRETYVNNLLYAADELAAAGRTLLIEPINPWDMPGYFLQSLADARALIAEARAVSGRPLANVAIQLDLYHRQMLEGRVTDAIDEFIDEVAHVQIAGVPGRHEPDARGELDGPAMLRYLEAKGYQGYVGCEYFPAAATEAGLAWAQPWLHR